jgi:hypothetical protein
MRKELIDELRQRHPRLLGPMGEPAIQPSIICGDGWFNLIDCLCEALTPHQISDDQPPARVEEIKSKYGGLRFYAAGLDAKGEAQVALSESLSERTCEVCGSPGSVVEKAGWIGTRCQAHSASGSGSPDPAAPRFTSASPREVSEAPYARGSQRPGGFIE